jgi:hypothetical protein
MTTVVQITGCIDIDGEVVPFVSNEDADFYGVYVGEVGQFAWQADFLHYEDAMVYVLAIHKAHGYVIDDKTYTEGNSSDKIH